MEYKIEKLSEKIRNISEDESGVIKRAIPFYNNVLERYEKMLLQMKDENDKANSAPKTIDVNNPFDVKPTTPKNDMPTIKDIKTFVYSAWAKTVADVQTPYGSTGQRKKNIVKHSFREVQKGKYINRKVKEIMKDYISKMSMALDFEENNNEKID